MISLQFQPSQKPRLPFEVFRLSELFARLERVRPAHLDVPLRMDFHLVYVGLRGRGEVIVDFARVPVGEGWLTVVPRGRVHQYVPESRRGDAWMLIFTPELVAVDLHAPLSLLTTGVGPAFALPSPGELHALCEQAAAEYARPDDDLQRPLLASILQTVLLRAERVAREAAPGIAPELVRFYAALDRDALTTRSVAHYAREAGVSARRLGELLPATPKQVIAERVVLEIQRLLAHTQLSIKEIAARAGFTEPTNLVKFVRQRTGESPLEFRARFDHATTRSDRGKRPARR